MKEHDREEKLRAKAVRYISRKEEESNFFDKCAESRMPKLEPDG